MSQQTDRLANGLRGRTWAGRLILLEALLLPATAAGVQSTETPAPARVEAAYTMDAYANTRGGIERGGDVLHNLDVTVSLDGEALVGAKGLEAFVYVLGNAGGSISALAGDWQGASNIEAPAAVRLYEAWVQQQLGDDWALLFGLYDLNSEFYVAETGGLFVHSAHGIGPEFAQSGPSGPSIFPVTSLTARLRWQPSSPAYALLGVFDAVPHDLGSPRVVDPPDIGGVLVTAEAGIARETSSGALYRKLGVGLWTYSSDFPDIVEAERMRPGAHGVYVLGEAELLREAGTEAQGMAAFARVGYADAAVHAVNWSWGGGVVYTGAVPGRNEDQAGLSFTVARHSDRYLEAQRRLGVDWERAEVAIDATYSAELVPGVRVQPVLQYIINPGMDPMLTDAVLLGARLELSR